MSVHSHREVNGRYVRIPCLFEVDDSGDRIVVGNITSLRKNSKSLY